MNDDQHPSDYIAPPAPRVPSSTPPGAKVAREVGHTFVAIAAIAAVTVLGMAGKLSEAGTIGTFAAIFAGYFALRKGEGAVDAQTIVDLMNKRTS